VARPRAREGWVRRRRRRGRRAVRGFERTPRIDRGVGRSPATGGRWLGSPGGCVSATPGSTSDRGATRPNERAGGGPPGTRTPNLRIKSLVRTCRSQSCAAFELRVCVSVLPIVSQLFPSLHGDLTGDGSELGIVISISLSKRRLFGGARPHAPIEPEHHVGPIAHNLRNAKQIGEFVSVFYEGPEGLERPVVILAELGDKHLEDRRSVPYVGGSRARNQLIVLAAKPGSKAPSPHWRHGSLNSGTGRTAGQWPA
jgi:hypothetical protein